MIGKYKHLLFGGLAALLVALSVSIVPAQPAKAAVETRACTDQEKKDGTGQESTTTQAGKTVTTCTTKDAASGDAADKSDASSDTTCAIEMMGWVLCPVMSTVGKIGDRAFSLLADNFLKTEPQLVSNTDLGTRYAWGLARNLANIMFIIALLIIIYSQVTGAGINNYGIKKMLPRLIVAAIAVNLSYFICQGMVDLSNIFGYEIKNFLDGAAASVSKFAAMPPAGSIAFGADSPGTLETIIKYALGVASLVWFLLPLMFMSAGSIVIICIIIVVILLLRKAFIVLLVVVSPIAFVLYLLPNTERYFRKWLSMLWQLLMVFPVVGLLFGGGQLASAIVLAAGSGAQSNQGGTYYSDKKCIQLPSYQSSNSGNNSTTLNLSATPNPATIGTCGTNSTSLMLGLIATGIAVAPLFAVVSVLKGALAAAGAMGGKISGAVESYGKKGGEKVQEKYKASTVGQMRARNKKINDINTRAGNYSGINPLRKGRSRLNRSLNNIGKDGGIKTGIGVLDGQLSNYSQQRGRMASKEDNAWITEKAQEFKASGKAGNEDAINELIDKMRGIMPDGSRASESDKKSALDELKAHSLATQGTALGKEVARAIKDAAANTAGMSGEGRTYVTGVRSSYEATERLAEKDHEAQATALSNALAPHLAAFTGATPPPGGGGPTPGGGTGGTGAGPTPPPGGGGPTPGGGTGGTGAGPTPPPGGTP